MSTLTGTTDNDLLNGSSSDDLITGAAGNDTLSGGSGQDTAVYAGNAADYRLGWDNGYLIVTDLNSADGDEGSDQLIGINTLQFADRSYAVLPGGETRVNTTALNHQLAPAVTTLADGGWLIAWQSYDQDGSGYGIYAQRYDHQGNPQGSETRVNVTTDADQSMPTVTALADGGWLVAWSSFGSGGSGIYAQRYDGQGNPVGDEMPVNAAVYSDQSTPTVTALTDGGWLVVWQFYGQDGSGYGIYAQRYDYQGNPVGDETRVNTYTFSDQQAPAITALADGGWLVVWSGLGSGGYGVYAQRYDAQGNRIGDETQVNTITGYAQSMPTVTALADGGWLVAWQSHYLGTDHYDIYSQRYDAQGNPVQLEIQGGADSDTLNGSGLIRLAGGAGDDRYVVADALVSIHERANAGIDTVQAAASHTLADNVENLLLTGVANLDGRGNALDNRITGNAGANRLEGGAGHDILDGGAGSDTAVYSHAANGIWVDLASGLASDDGDGGSDTLLGIENVQGSAHDDQIHGDARANILAGGDGDDRLSGRAGNDILDGGAGQDTAVYAGNAADYLLGWRDGYLTITDLNRADGDEGSDLLGAIETLQFADRSYSVRPGGETFVNTSIADIQQDPSVTALADGGWLVTWESYKEDDNGWDIHAQRYDASGHRLGGEVLVNTSTADFQQGSAVTALPDGGWLITWESESRRICSQRYDALGNTMGSETLVAITSGSAYPSIATLADGGWLIAWETHNPTAGEFDIYTQRYDAQGNAIGGPAPVAVSQTSHQVLPTVTALADGGWLVAWTSVDQNTWDNDIYMRRFDAQGTASGPDVRVNSTTSDTQHHAAIAALGDGGWLITWNAENQDGSGYGVYAQRYDAQGNPLGGETRVNTTILDDQYNAAVTVLADGGWLVVWQSNNQDGSGYGIYAQRYDAQGNRLGGETQVSTYTDSHQQAPAITTLADGGWLVAWQSHGQDGSSDGIYSQRFDAQGHALQMEVIDASGNHLGILAASDRTLSGQEQNLVLVGYANINGTGNALGNQISGNAGDNRLDAGAGNDILSGGGGSDTLIGGDGADIFLYQNRADSRLGAMDTIGDLSAQDRLNFAGMDGIQLRPGGYTFHGSLAMTLAVIQADTGIANQVVFFSDGIDGYLYLKGAGTGVSFDGTLIKLSGQTTPPTARQLSLAHSIESASTYTLGANDDNLTLSGIANINGTGNNFANWLIGNAGRNTLNGGLGDDRLDGRGGSDKLVGGGGNDTYIVDLIPKGSGAKISIRLEDSISESANAGSDTLQLRGTIATSGYTTLTLASTLENLDASATGNTKLNLTGNKANNVLYGNDADNILDGKVGTDTLIGGAGNDTYVLDSLAEVGLIGELAGGGEADTLRIAYKNKSRSTAEVVDLSTQPNLENIIITGTGLFDLIGNEADNSLIGNASANRLVGGAGNDLLDGQAGADTLTGGAGADLFRFDSLKDLGLGNGRQDVITDFVRGEDKLDFTALVGWRFVEGPPSSGNKQLWFVNDDPAGGTLYGNSGGSAKADFAIKLLGVTELHASDFL